MIFIELGTPHSFQVEQMIQHQARSSSVSALPFERPPGTPHDAASIVQLLDGLCEECRKQAELRALTPLSQGGE